MDDNGVTNDGGVPAQWQVGVGEELLGGAEVDDFASHIQFAQFRGEISHPAS